MTDQDRFPLRPALGFGALFLVIGMAAPEVAYAVFGGPNEAMYRVPPPWPPQWGFPLAWAFLYPTMGVATAYVWRERARHPFATTAMIVFAVHLLINISWVPIVQASHRPLTVSVVMDFVVDLASLFALWAYAKVSRPATLWLLPYLGWEVFTTTIKVWRLLLNT